jgi:hypothetical protein
MREQANEDVARREHNAHGNARDRHAAAVR